MKIFGILALAFVLGSCGFESREDFEKDQGLKSETTSEELPEIKYVKNTKTTPSINFENLYGKAKVSERTYLKDAIGNLVSADFAGSEIGISIKPSQRAYNTYPAVLSYDQAGMLVEKEYGPVAAGDNIFSQVDFDIISSESGPMLLVSQIVISDSENTSAYYLYNRYMSLVDSFQFVNSTANTDVYVYRLGSLIEGGNVTMPGDLKTAIDKRMISEEKHLKDILDLYKVKYSKVKGKIENKEIEVGHLADPGHGRIIDIKFNDRDENGAILSIK